MLNRHRAFFTLVLIVVTIFIIFQNLNWLFKTVYPIHYYDLVEKYCEEYGIDPYLVVAIIKNESRFDTRAISKKEARGLMQIAPITGVWASEKLGILNYSEDMLFQPDLNIRIGVWYLSILKKEFHNDLGLIIAGYNAGNGNVKKWLGDPRYSRDGKTLDEIPFGETRIYQKRVLRDYKIYSKIYRNKY